MGIIAVQTIDKNPTVLTYTSAGASGDVVSNTIGFDLILNVKNNGSTSINVAISATTPCDQGDYEHVSTQVSPGTIGIFPLHSRISNWSTRTVNIRYDTVSDVTVAAYRILR